MINDTNFPKAADEYARCVSPYFNIEDKQEKYKADKLFKRLRRKVGHAIGDYGMIEENDRILVCMSGGKDSYVLLDMLMSLKRSAPINFELIPVHIDSNFPNAPEYLLEDHLKKVGLEYHFLKKPVYDICKEKIADGIPYCSLCSRLRRGYLYSFAREIGANKVALGHHKDDCLATFFLNIFYSGMMKAMPPVLRNDKDDLTVIRPLIYCRERDLITLSKIKNYPVLPKGLCGFGEDQQRSAMNKMIKQWDKEYPKRADIVFKALKNVAPSHLLDKELFDFTKISNGPKVK
ncbi:tRNA 2-thiocytidine(32) synthetase TtcA [Succinivibrio sp.]|uniref:tRNA 2-thiocytidine(32) synthetase TtcA n=1 Tax=Succinivibrio sp. TaxID=2053619 RepID=UPI00258636BD|nr:tRNA 2-thiocytidine(32) synthetase TtcA [Succinivibrio sp.]MDD6205859.1 tRNA 2-thiocytidine(32) synthetase TtcA [Succinivibrio sp.]